MENSIDFRTMRACFYVLEKLQTIAIKVSTFFAHVPLIK